MDHELQYETHFAGIVGRDGNRSSFSLAVPSFVLVGNPQAILDFNPEEYFV
jgi:hypothetical protein